MPRLQHMERERVTKWPLMRSEKFSAEGRRFSGEKFSFVAVEFKEVVGHAGFNVCRTVCQGAVAAGQTDLVEIKSCVSSV